jgi:hypothetical protein
VTLDWTCPACGFTPATESERQRHEAGTDAQQLACPRQDIEAIKAEQQANQRGLFLGKVLG